MKALLRCGKKEEEAVVWRKLGIGVVHAKEDMLSVLIAPGSLLPGCYEMGTTMLFHHDIWPHHRVRKKINPTDYGL
jgi:hypothetical protein